MRSCRPAVGGDTRARALSGAAYAFLAATPGWSPAGTLTAALSDMAQQPASLVELMSLPALGAGAFDPSNQVASGIAVQ